MSFKPYVAPEATSNEFSVKAVLAGILFGVVFGAANAYLGLRIGLTISTSIPVAVVTVAIFRALRGVLGPSTILEHNTSQTIGSASSSLASGIIFTIPALFMWGLNPSILQIATLGALGGLMGVLYMVPLRRFLIVKEHAVLPYPEGTACAEVLVAADKGGNRARPVFIGIAIGLASKFILSFLKLWPSKVNLQLPFIPKALVSMETTPALLGVGYILGIRIATVMVLGSLIAWVILIPLIAKFGGVVSTWLIPDFGLDLQAASEGKIWHHYIRYVGAGGVTFGGIVTLVRALPDMWEALRKGLEALTGKIAANSDLRTEADLNFKYIFVGISIIVLFITLSPHVIGTSTSLAIRLMSAIAIALFGFLFVTVSSRIVGFIGVSSNPTSGMTIVTLLGTSSIFLLLGMNNLAGQAAALTIGTVVCTAASIAGDCSQDLKTGYLLGATPRKQQIGEVIGVLTASIFVASAVALLGKTYGFGSQEIPAPQAVLMKTVIEGVLSSDLPWGLLLVGALLTAFAEFVLKLPGLAFAVGVYIPVFVFVPIYFGGLVRKLTNRKSKNDAKASLAEQETNPGVLMSSGFIAGEGLMGVLIALIAFITSKKSQGVGFGLTGIPGELFSLLVFTVLAVYLYRSVVHKKPEN